MFNLTSPRTTVLGVLTLVGAVVVFGKALLDGDPSTVPDLETIIIAAAGAGLIAARDNKTTSEEANAK